MSARLLEPGAPPACGVPGPGARRGRLPLALRWVLGVFLVVLGAAGCGAQGGDAPSGDHLAVGQVLQAASCVGVVCPTCQKCLPASGLCGADAAQNGNACASDGNACTTDLCAAGACAHAAGNAGTVCRATAGLCDQAETCTGASTVCPAADAKLASGTACADDGNACTTDRCDGTTNACQHAAGNAGTVCRAAVDVCDVADTCDGASTVCTDLFVASTVTCRAAASACDAAERCTGAASACPADASLADGTSCDDGTLCTAGDACNAGQCIGASPVVCTASDVCHVPGLCDPTTGLCSAEVQVASCVEADLDFVRVSVEYTAPTAVPTVAECDPYNNWGAMKSGPLFPCGQVSANAMAPQPFTVTRVFQATCPAGEGPQWGFFAYTTSTPAGTSVEFRFQSFAATNGQCVAQPAVTQSPPNPLATASLAADPEACAMSGPAPACPKDLFFYLQNGHAPCLQMDARGIPSATEGPLLMDWSATYTCLPNQ
jgi:hypothetical protein